MQDSPGLTRWLTACRHDIAHLRGITDEQTEAWVAANLAEGLNRFNATHNERLKMGTADDPHPDDGLTPVEAALAAVKVWAQAA